MSRKLIGFTLLPCAWFVLGATATPTPAPTPNADNLAEYYWGCRAGYTFEVSNNNAVHCKKPAYVSKKAYVPCAFPTPTTKIDLVGTTDMCAGSGAIGIVSAEPICPLAAVSAGYTKRHVAGEDYCGKNYPQEIIGPSEPVSR